jgi:hypothetical protein
VDLPTHGARLRGLWLTSERYANLRNMAWLVRNSRTRQENNPIALQYVVAETERLLQAGETLPDVIEALAELLIHP